MRGVLTGSGVVMVMVAVIIVGRGRLMVVPYLVGKFSQPVRLQQQRGGGGGGQ